MQLWFLLTIEISRGNICLTNSINGDSKSGDAVESAAFCTTVEYIKVDQTITRLDLVSVVMLLTS